MTMKTIHLIRHAQGPHQLEPISESVKIHDPHLTELGVSRCAEFARGFPRQHAIDLLCASPLRRAIQTAEACFPHHHIHPHTRPILLLPDAQEDSDDPCDSGSSPLQLRLEYGNLIDLQYVPENWTDKTIAKNSTSAAALIERAGRLRSWISHRPEREIAIVGHGAFFHFVTGDVNSHAEQTGVPSSIIECRFCLELMCHIRSSME